MRVIQLVPLFAIGAWAGRETVPVKESAIRRFLKHPFGLGRNDPKNDPLNLKPNPDMKDPLYLKTLNRSE